MTDEQDRHPAIPAHLYETGAVTYYGLGSHAFEWNETKRITCEPDRDFHPQKFGIPSMLEGYTIHQIEVEGQPMLVAGRGVPAELFSEVSTFPQARWPMIGKGKPAIFEVTAPPPPPRPRPFTGAFYGSRPFTAEELERRAELREKLAEERERGLPDTASCAVHLCEMERRYDGDDSMAPRKWAAVSFIDEGGESEDFMLCEFHANKVKAILTGAL